MRFRQRDTIKRKALEAAFAFTVYFALSGASLPQSAPVTVTANPSSCRMAAGTSAVSTFFSIVAALPAQNAMISSGLTGTGGAGADFRITAVRLTFKNERPEITVRRNDPTLRVRAEISFTGSGLMNGYWEVEGTVFSRETRHLVGCRTITIELPPGASLPTFTPGTHRVRFVITDPMLNIPAPEAVYFVTAREYDE